MDGVIYFYFEVNKITKRKMAIQTIEIHDELLKRIDSIASALNLTRTEWIANVLTKAIRRESTREKILDVVAREYLDKKIDFEGMVSLIGYDEAARIKGVAEGAERSIHEADNFAKKLRNPF